MWYFYSLRLKDIHIHQHTLRWETRSQSPLFLPLYLRQESRQTRSQSPFLSPQGPPHDFMKEWHLASVIHTSPEFKNKTKNQSQMNREKFSRQPYFLLLTIFYRTSIGRGFYIFPGCFCLFFLWESLFLPHLNMARIGSTHINISILVGFSKTPRRGKLLRQVCNVK